VDRRLYILNTPGRRKFVADVVSKLTKGWRVEIKAPQRTLPQNDKMWAVLTDVSEQHTHGGIKLEPKDWRLIFLDAYWREKGEELRVVPNLDGTGFVPLSGRSTSDLSVDEMSEYIELIHMHGATWGVTFNDDGQGGSGANNPRAEAA
jgi:hypothetical protein